MHLNLQKLFYIVDGQQNDSLIIHTSTPQRLVRGMATMMPRRSGHVQKHVTSTPIHLQYTMYSNTKCTWKGWTLPITWEERTRVTRGQHKGWHRLFYYVLGTSLVDMHIIHKETMKRRGTPKGGHERYGLPKTSSLNLDQEVEPNMGNMPTEKWTHVPMRSKLRWKCVLCRRRCNNICNHDGGLHMCLFTLLIAKSTHPVRLDSVSSHQWHFMTFIL